MKRLLCFCLAFLLSFLSCFRFSWADTVDDVSAPDLSQIAEPTYDPSIDYFCVEHLQPLIADEDLEPGQEQICLGCHPEYLDMQPVSYAENATPLFPSGVAFLGGGASWANCPTLIGENQSIFYQVNSFASNNYGSFRIRLIFGSVQQGKGYLNASVTNAGAYPDKPATTFNAMYSSFSFSDEFSNLALFMGDLNKYYPLAIQKRSGTISGNTIYLRFTSQSALGSNSSYKPDVKFNIGSFAFSDEMFAGTIGGSGGGQVTPPEPEPPGFDKPDGWLGKLMDSILSAVNEVIKGISNIAQNIANLPGLIADALRSMLNAIKNAITAIGNQISSAIEALGNFLIEGLKSLFIPSEGYFEGKANEMRTWLEQHLGLLVYPFTLVADLAERVAGLQNGEPVVHVPEIAYIQDTEKYVLIAEQDVNIYDQVNRKQIFLDIHRYYLMAMDAAIAMALVVLAWKKFDQITGGRDT